MNKPVTLQIYPGLKKWKNPKVTAYNPYIPESLLLDPFTWLQ